MNFNTKFYARHLKTPPKNDAKDLILQWNTGKNMEIENIRKDKIVSFPS